MQLNVLGGLDYGLRQVPEEGGNVVKSPIPQATKAELPVMAMISISEQITARLTQNHRGVNLGESWTPKKPVSSRCV